MAHSRAPEPTAGVSCSIVVLRGHKVLLDEDLAALYGVSTKRFNEQIRRNRERFPQDFMFQITTAEAAALRSQFATSKEPGRGGRLFTCCPEPAGTDGACWTERKKLFLRRVISGWTVGLAHTYNEHPFDRGDYP